MLPDVAPATRPVEVREALELCPILREDYVAAALLEPDSSDIDVHALHQGYLRLFRRRAGRLVTNAPVEGLERGARGWTVGAGTERFTAPLLVNAAGAWADEIAALAGLAAWVCSRGGEPPCWSMCPPAWMSAAGPS